MIYNLAGRGLTTLSGLTFPAHTTKIILDGNNLTSLSGLPTGISYVSICGNSSLVSLSDVPEGVVTIVADDCAITSSTTVPSTLKYLYINNNELTNLSFLSGMTMDSVFASNNNITSLTGCPDAKELVVSNNSLTNLQNLSTAVKRLDVSHNNLSDITDLTESHQITQINISGNSITSLSGIPSSCHIVNDYNSNVVTLTNVPTSVLRIDSHRVSTTGRYGSSSYIFPVRDSGYRISSSSFSIITRGVVCSYLGPFNKLLVNISGNGVINMRVVQVVNNDDIVISDKNIDGSVNDVHVLYLDNYVNVTSTIEIHAKKVSGSSSRVYSCVLVNSNN